MKRLILFFLATLTFTALASPVQALSGSQFNAGRIIDDSVFYNYGSMSVQQIQQFLDSKINCDRNGTQQSELGGGTRAQYGAAHGTPAPFTCLNMYFENTDTRQNNLDGRPIPSGGISAAQIIWNEAQNYHVNPQVLMTIIQREQGLITDSWPLDPQYDAAAGYGCPDNGPNHTIVCQNQYFGFYNQVANAAWQLRQYGINPNAFNYVAYQDNTVQWSPQPSCGTSVVHIQTMGTAALYNYAPYRPNQASLNNLYGLGDSCSAYANRNFWRYFNDWFGSTLGNRYSASYYAQAAYPTVQAGHNSTTYLMYRNSGTAPWHDATTTTPGQPAIVLAATNPINRWSFFSSSWPGVNRPAINFAAVYESDGTTLASDQHVAQPGQVVKYQFTYSVPPDMAPGTYHEWFQPVAEGDPQWFMDGIGWQAVVVTKADYAARFRGFSGYPTTQRGSKSTVTIDYENTGNLVWRDSVSATSGQTQIHLANDRPINRSSPFQASGWINNNRPAGTFAVVFENDGHTLASDQHVAQPGQVVRFQYDYSISATQAQGTYTEWIKPVAEGETYWNMGADGYFNVNVTAPNVGVKFNGFSGYPTVNRGSSATVTIDYQNIGLTTLYDSTTGGSHPTNLADTLPINRSSALNDTGWVNDNRPSGIFKAVYESDGTTLTADQHRASPGQIIRYQYKYTAPSNMPPGVYREWIQPVVEMDPSWDIQGLGYFDVTVQ